MSRRASSRGRLPARARGSGAEKGGPGLKRDTRRRKPVGFDPYLGANPMDWSVQARGAFVAVTFVCLGIPGYRPGVPGRPVHPDVRPPVVRPPVAWVNRPGWYRWPAGGAVTAGAALGFVSAAAAASWAGAPPQAGLCWYYTDPSRRQG